MVNDNKPINSIAELVGAPRCTYVVVYTDENVYSGYITHAISERFLDVLNQGSIVDKQESTNDFLCLTDVEIYTMDGRKKDVANNCLLNKNSTLAVAEIKITSGELPPSKPFSYGLFQEKKPVWVKILIQHLSLVGQVHISQNEKSILALDLDQIFIPVTGATLSSTVYSPQPEFNLIAVNKNRVISILELADK
jgi:hypothetical protein